MSSSQDFVNSPEPAAKRLKLDSEDIEIGSLVWARLPNSIWWPAIVEKMSDNHCYRVLFFDDAAAECSLQGWNTHEELLTFTGVEDNIEGETCANGVDLCEPLQRAVNLARAASTRSRADLVHALQLRNGLAQAGEGTVAAVPGLSMRVASNEVGAGAPRPQWAFNQWVGEACQWNASVSASPRVDRVALGELNCQEAAVVQNIMRLLESDTESEQEEEEVEEVEEQSVESSVSAASSLASSYTTSGCSALYWEATDDDAVVPGTQEAVCPLPGDTRYDAVVPWNLDRDDHDDYQDDHYDGDGDDGDDGRPGWPSSEGVVPAPPCDASMGDDVNAEE